MDGLAKPEFCEGFGADRVLGHMGSPTGVGDKENSQGWQTPTHLTVSVANLVKYAD